MIEVLREVVDCASGLGFEVIKVTAGDDRVAFEAVNGDRTAIMKAFTKKPIAGLEGTFVLTNLSLLSGVVNMASMRDAAVDIVCNDSTGEVEMLKISGKETNVVYRTGHDSQAARQPNMRAVPWDVDHVELGKLAFARFKEQATVFGSVGQGKYTPAAADGVLTLTIGDPAGMFTTFGLCESDATLMGQYKYPLSHTSTVLSHTNNKTVKMSIAKVGVMQFDVGDDESILDVTYILPGQSA